MFSSPQAPAQSCVPYMVSPLVVNSDASVGQSQGVRRSRTAEGVMRELQIDFVLREFVGSSDMPAPLGALPSPGAAYTRSLCVRIRSIVDSTSLRLIVSLQTSPSPFASILHHSNRVTTPTAPLQRGRAVACCSGRSE